MHLTLSSINISAWRLFIHDRNNLIIASSKIYGSDRLKFDFNTLLTNFYEYEVIATETTFIDQENDPCIAEEDSEKENVFQCLEKYKDSLFNCMLPWRYEKVEEGLPLCSHPEEFDQWETTFSKYYTNPHSIEKEAKCSPTCRRFAYSTKLYQQARLTQLSDSVKLSFFYNQYEVPVREHVWAYDWVNLVSDFGGWLGILLGYSILGFYNTFLLFLGNVKNTMTRKRQLSTTRNQTASPKPVETIKTSIAIQVEPRQASPAI